MGNGQLISSDPVFAVEIFHSSIADGGGQNHVFVGQHSLIGSDFQSRSDFVDVFNHKILCGDITRRIGHSELISAVCRNSQLISRHPVFSVEVFHRSVTDVGSQNHVFVGQCSLVCGDFQCRCDLVNVIDFEALFGDIARRIGHTELICAVFGNGQTTASAPLGTVKVFNHAITDGGSQYHIFVGQRSLICSDFQCRCDLVNVIDFEALFGDIPRSIGDTELVSAILGNGQLISSDPVFAVEIFHSSIADGGGQNHVFVGQHSLIGSDFQSRSDFVDVFNHKILCGDITRRIGHSELISAVCRNSQLISRNPAFAVEIFHSTIADGGGQNHIRVGQYSLICRDFQCRSDFVNVTDFDALFGDIARRIGNTEGISAVFTHNLFCSLNPGGAVMEHNCAVADRSRQDNVLVCPFGGIAADCKSRGDFVDFVDDNHLHITLIAEIVNSVENICPVFID